MRVTLTPLDSPLRSLALVDGSRKANDIPHAKRLPVETVLDVNSLSEGWYSSLEPDVEDKPIPGWHGSYLPAFIRLKQRTVTLRGHRLRRLNQSESSSMDDARFRDYLSALEGETIRLEVEDEDGYRYSDGYVAAQITYSSDMGFTQFSVILSLEPFKHGTAGMYPVLSGSVHVDNDGTAPSWPTLLVEHPKGLLTEVSVTDGTHEVVWQSDDGTDELELDFSLLNPSVGMVSMNDVFTIPPGGLDVYATATRGASIVIRSAPSWK